MENKYFDLVKLKKLEELHNLKHSPYGEFVVPPNFLSNINFILKYENSSLDELKIKKEIVSLVGRIRLKRGPFLVVENDDCSIQVYLSKIFIQENKKLIDLLDLGDIILVKGSPMRTKTNQLSLECQNIEILTKILNNLPEKWHGLSDREARYRERYLDLLTNKDSKDIFIKRSSIIKKIREFFDNKSYIEVETPFLQSFLGGAAARPFKTFHNSLHSSFYLRIATEIPLKKLLVGGINKVYEIGRIFRNEGIDTTHNPEFTSIEFYQAYGNLNTMMEQTEELFHYLVKFLKKDTFVFNNHKIALTQPFKKIDLIKAVSNELKIDVINSSFDQLKKIALDRNIKIPNYFEKGHLIYAFFDELLEKQMIQPTFVYNFPIEVSPLAKKNPDNPSLTNRAELFIGGKEFANMFSELNDPIDQLNRFLAQLKEKESGNDEANEIDHDFIKALSYGMPPAGGCGIGIDRLIMLFTEQHSIRDVLLFPYLKDKKND
ncbi:MAG: lysine--tRNA ligase [Mycoplasma sp.]|nr:lysine--tRNA ligase [Mycoplasma sp.]